MTKSSLEAVLAERGNPVRMLRDSRIGVYVYPVVAAEFSNWRDEQKAWRDSAVLFDQSHHMDEVIVEGPDAERFLQGLAINSFKGFGTNRAKHFVPVGPEGYVIGDMICFREREDRFVLVGRAPTANWVEYNGTLGTHDVQAHPRPALAVAARRQPGRARALPLPDPGAGRAARSSRS